MMSGPKTGIKIQITSMALAAVAALALCLQPGPARAGEKAAKPPAKSAAAAPAKEKKSCPAGMVPVPAGKFIMGCAAEDTECIRKTEGPARRVYLDSFCIDKTEVTNEAYEKCAATGQCAYRWNDGCFVVKGQEYSEALSSEIAPELKKPDHPAVCSDWSMAGTYCEWAGKRLPSEAEWEKAARGADGRIYPWGNKFAAGKADFCDKNCPADWKSADYDDGFAMTAPAGSFPAGASPYGALDMAGNAWEWVADCYSADWYSRMPASNPVNKDPDCDKRSIRGGSFGSYFSNLRADHRMGMSPDIRFAEHGFRCASDL